MIQKQLFKVVASVCSMFICVLALAQSPNPVVKRLSYDEINDCTTPSAVTYNFIESILCRDFDRMLSYCSSEYAKDAIREITENNLTYDLFFVRNFSDEGGYKLNILGWIPALAANYEVAIAYEQDEWYYEKDSYLYSHFNQVVKDGMIYIPGESVPHIGILRKKIYVTCSPSAEINYVGFQDITRYGNTNVKVLLENVGGVWKVIGFK